MWAGLRSAPPPLLTALAVAPVALQANEQPGPDFIDGRRGERVAGATGAKRRRSRVRCAPPFAARQEDGAGGGNRTHTPGDRREILSLLRLPVSAPRPAG